MQPKLVVCLGAVAAQSLLGAGFKVTVDHGVVEEVKGLPPIMATVHPASILRARSEEDRHLRTESFISDLKLAARFLRAR